MNRGSHIMQQEGESVVIREVGDVVAASRDEIVQAEHRVPVRK